MYEGPTISRMRRVSRDRTTEVVHLITQAVRRADVTFDSAQRGVIGLDKVLSIRLWRPVPLVLRSIFRSLLTLLWALDITDNIMKQGMWAVWGAERVPAVSAIFSICSHFRSSNCVFERRAFILRTAVDFSESQRLPQLPFQ